MKWINSKIVAAMIIGVGIVSMECGNRMAMAQVDQATLSPSATTAPSPTLINLHVKDTDAREVLKLIEKQANVSIKLSDPQMWTNANDTVEYKAYSVSLDLNNVPFWTALGQLCRATHTRLADVPRAITLSGGTADDVGGLGGPSCDAGLFTVVAGAINHSGNASLGSKETERNDSIDLSIYLDPKIKLLKEGEVHLDLAEDERGVSMLDSKQNDGKGPLTDETMCHWGTGIQSGSLKYPAKVGHTMHVKGHMLVDIADQISNLVIEDASHSAGDSVSVAGRSMTLTSFNLTGNIVVKVSVKRPSGLSEESFKDEFRLGDGVQGGIDMIDTDGTVFPMQLANGGNSKGTDAKLTFGGNASYPNPPKMPVKLLWRVIVHDKTVDVPFEFKDLPLPQD